MLMVAVLAAFALQAGEQDSAPKPTGEIALSPELNQTISSFFENYFLDYESARLRLLKAPVDGTVKKTLVLKASGTIVCYDVNARNEFGAYAGFDRMLLVVRDGEVIYRTSEFNPDGFTSSSAPIRQHCGDSGRSARTYSFGETPASKKTWRD
jgi:hypothetical protein